MLEGKKKYLLNSLYEKLKNKVSLSFFKTNIKSKESCLFQGQTNKGQIYSIKILNGIKA